MAVGWVTALRAVETTLCTCALNMNMVHMFDVCSTWFQAHNDLLRTYEAKLNQFGVPTEELGFKPFESAVGGQALGQGPAGLVSAPT